MHNLRCRIFGHRLRFGAEGRVMRWWCEHGCPDAEGSKDYATEEDARRYAHAFDGVPRGFGRRKRD